MSNTPREDVIKLAREAGFVVDDESRKHQPNCIFHTYHLVDDLLERFYQLAIAKAVTEERDACAELMEQQHTWIANIAASAAIRARSNTFIEVPEELIG